MTHSHFCRIGWRLTRRMLPLICCTALLSACAQHTVTVNRDSDPSQEIASNDGPPDIAPDADAMLRSACDYLAKSPQFSVSAEVWEDVVLKGTGHKMQLSRTVDVKVRRPDRLRAEMKAVSAKSIYYDGQTVTIFKPAENVYGVVAAPDTLDKTLDFASETYGVEMPLQDILVSDPYASATANVRIGRDLGMEVALGTECHHLAFSQDTIDWQLWIEDGPKPLIRKLVITYKLDEGSPQFTALFTKWDMDTQTPESAFTFTIPAGAGKFEVLPRNQESSQK